MVCILHDNGKEIEEAPEGRVSVNTESSETSKDYYVEIGYFDLIIDDGFDHLNRIERTDDIKESKYFDNERDALIGAADLLIVESQPSRNRLVLSQALEIQFKDISGDRPETAQEL